MSTIEKVKKLELSISKKEERIKKLKKEIEQQKRKIEDIQESCDHNYKTAGLNYDIRVCIHCGYSYFDSLD